ncbi:hypothetical protein KC717_03730 [Candidatus Dojkabacteria bacterium]|uniref:Alpha/beta hydrolase n=1 Tax=Candidatus Dojkabacteria bacterium TaxID=2099670 RepID=A0A955L8N1_9BACT|nr:hypothetical protein [Candidatus Dojkabacteria bacterium]
MLQELLDKLPNRIQRRLIYLMASTHKHLNKNRPLEQRLYPTIDLVTFGNEKTEEASENYTIRGFSIDLDGKLQEAHESTDPPPVTLITPENSAIESTIIVMMGHNGKFYQDKMDESIWRQISDVLSHHKSQLAIVQGAEEERSWNHPTVNRHLDDVHSHFVRNGTRPTVIGFSAGGGLVIDKLAQGILPSDEHVFAISPALIDPSNETDRADLIKYMLLGGNSITNIPESLQQLRGSLMAISSSRKDSQLNILLSETDSNLSIQSVLKLIRSMKSHGYLTGVNIHSVRSMRGNGHAISSVFDPNFLNYILTTSTS